MTGDEINGKMIELQKGRANPLVQYWLKVGKELGETLLVQEFNATGEEAIRALGVQKGISMMLNLDKIYESQVQQQVSSKIIKPR